MLTKNALLLSASFRSRCETRFLAWRGDGRRFRGTAYSQKRQPPCGRRQGVAAGDLFAVFIVCGAEFDQGFFCRLLVALLVGNAGGDSFREPGPVWVSAVEDGIVPADKAQIRYSSAIRKIRNALLREKKVK